MTSRTWVILGATSIIAEEFAHLAAKAGHSLRLVGRNQQQLMLIAQDIRLRYKVPCDIFALEMNELAEHLTTLLKSNGSEFDVLIAHSDFTNNDALNIQSIEQLIQVNCIGTIQLIHTYLQSSQSQHNLLYLSSVAAARGRAKNSLYGASKAAVELYLEGLQQTASKQTTITIARLGFIDTRQTYGFPGIFYAAPPRDCAKACWKAIHKKKSFFYYPGFWGIIMKIINCMPFFLYKKMGRM